MAKLLLIDDNIDLLEIQAEFLRHAGHEVSVSVDAEKAFALLPEGNFDLVMTDIIMPDKDGLEVIMALKRIAPTIKIIAVSGGGRIDATSYLDLAVKLGAKASLSKPFSGETLIATVNRVLSA